MIERLQKIIARAGIASRRRAEDLIVSGQVEVNGKVVTELGVKADPERDVIRVAGRRLRFPERRLLLALNKPDACVSTLSDPAGRKTLRDFLHGVAGRVYPVGGLEYHSTGLVLLTSDGDLAARLSRALGGGLPQTYQVKVKNPLSPAEMAVIAQRIAPLRPSRRGRNPWYEVRLAGGQKEFLRRILFEMGHPPEKLKRVAIGRFELGNLQTGRWRALSEAEIRGLEEDMKRSVAGAAGRSATAPKPGRQDILGSTGAVSVKESGRPPARRKFAGAGGRPPGRKRKRGREFDRERKPG